LVVVSALAHGKAKAEGQIAKACHSPSIQSANKIVTSAKAGFQGQVTERLPWIPAFAGMTNQ
jgi:hypothetical protein